MKILLTGASGFLGSYLSRRLLDEGHTLTAVARPERADALTQVGCKVVCCNFTVARHLPEVGEQDVAIYLAQSSEYRNWPDGVPDTIDVNLSGLAYFAEAARKSGVQRFLLASTGTVYKPSFHPLRENDPLETEKGTVYSFSKRSAEELIRFYREFYEVAVLRMFSIYGPGQVNRMIPGIIQRVIENRPVYLEPKDEFDNEPSGLVVSMVHVETICQMIIEIMHSSFNGVVNLAGQQSSSVKELAVAIGEILKKEPLFDTADHCRRGDYVADTSLLNGFVEVPYESIRSRLEQVIHADFNSSIQ